MQTDAPATPTAFEHESCSRCGGSGRYSWCQSHGDRCFKCGGRGWTFTKRGAVAAQVYADSLRIPAGDVEAGQKIRVEGIPGMLATKWHLVVSVERDGEMIRFATKTRRAGASEWDDANLVDDGYGCPATSATRVSWTNDERRAKIAVAVAYQETLTKKGEPRKTGRAA